LDLAADTFVSLLQALWAGDPLVTKLNTNTWQIILQKWLRREQPMAGPELAALIETPFYRLPVAERVRLLDYVCNAVLNSGAIR
jgi:hypothetical protein